jgi:hypothetical protein
VWKEEGSRAHVVVYPRMARRHGHVESRQGDVMLSMAALANELSTCSTDEQEDSAKDSLDGSRSALR